MTRTLRRILLSAAGALALASVSATASPAIGPAAGMLACGGGPGENCGQVQLVQATCGAAAAAAARQYGGQVIGAPRAVQQGGRTVCVVTILIPDPSGQRPPVRKQVTVPAR